MTREQVEQKITELVYREPFAPFIVELEDGRSLRVPHPRLSFDHSGAGFIDLDGALVDFGFVGVRSIREFVPEGGSMTIQQIEAKFIELKHRKPFMPFIVEMIDGSTIVVPHSGLSIDYTGAGFIDDEAGLVDVPFDKVRSIRVASIVELS